MTRNASFVVLLLVKKLVIFSQWDEQVKPSTCIVHPPWFDHQNIIVCKQTHTKRFTMKPKSDPKWCAIGPAWPITSDQSLHPFCAITFIISHFGTARKSIDSWSSAQIVVIHRFSFFVFLPYVIRCGSKNKFLWDMCLRENGIRA